MTDNRITEDTPRVTETDRAEWNHAGEQRYPVLVGCIVFVVLPAVIVLCALASIGFLCFTGGGC